MVTKNRLVKVMADRCLAGEFGGSYFRAARKPECVALGISHQRIQYHMHGPEASFGSYGPSGGPARVSAETASAAAEGADPIFVFVERGLLRRRQPSRPSLASSNASWKHGSGMLPTSSGTKLPPPIRPSSRLWKWKPWRLRKGYRTSRRNSRSARPRRDAWPKRRPSLPKRGGPGDRSAPGSASPPGPGFQGVAVKFAGTR